MTSSKHVPTHCWPRVVLMPTILTTWVTESLVALTNNGAKSMIWQLVWGLTLLTDAMQLLLAWTLRNRLQFQSSVLVVPPEVTNEIQSLQQQYMTLDAMDMDSQEGREACKIFHKEVNTCEVFLFVTANMDMFDKAFIAYVCNSADTKTWCMTVAVNASDMKNIATISGYMHVNPFLPERTTGTACELEPLSNDGFHWFLNLAWHWIHDADVLNDDKHPTIPLPFSAVPFGEVGSVTLSFSQIHFKAQSTFVERDSAVNSGLGTGLNLSQIACKWPPMLPWCLPKASVCDITLPSGARVIMLDPRTFGLAGEHWSICDPNLAILRMRRQCEVFVDWLAMLCNI
jgi:hypothetical protein